jgi:hypothetical protein
MTFGSEDNEGPLHLQRTKVLQGMCGLAAYRADGEIDHLQQQLGQPIVGITAQGSGQRNSGQGPVAAPPGKRRQQ